MESTNRFKEYCDQLRGKKTVGGINKKAILTGVQGEHPIQEHSPITEKPLSQPMLLENLLNPEIQESERLNFVAAKSTELLSSTNMPREFSHQSPSPRMKVPAPAGPTPKPQMRQITILQSSETPYKLAYSLVAKHMAEHHGDIPTVIFIHSSRSDAMKIEFEQVHSKYQLKYKKEIFFACTPYVIRTISICTEKEIPSWFDTNKIPQNAAVAMKLS